MTQKEFFNHTGVYVSDKEWWAINEVYNYSDLDKDEFCKMWCKMNKTRVERVKGEKKQQQEREKNNDILFKWFESWKNSKTFEENYYTNVAYINLTTSQVKAMSYVGIRFGNAENLSDLHYKVGKYLGIYK